MAEKEAMKFMILALSAVLLGCGATTPKAAPVFQGLTYERVRPAFHQACLNSAGPEQNEFCDCAWEKMRDIFSVQEIVQGVSHTSQAKRDAWKSSVWNTCVPKLQ